MNILPKKRWHVRTRENIARVRKDEAKAREEEQKRQERAEIADREAKRELLRQKARLQYGTAETNDKPAQSPEPASSTDGHVNLFHELEENIDVTRKTNEEHEKEKKEEREKYEKQIGYLTYLGQDTHESLGTVSWYNTVPDRSKEGEEIGLRQKELEDPLREIRKYLGAPGIKKITENRTSDKIIKRESNETLTQKPVKAKKVKKEKKKKKKRKHSHRDSDSDSDSDHRKKKNRKSVSSCKSDSDSEDSVPVEKNKVDLEKLRAERLRREKEERKRAEALLAKLRGETVEEVKPKEPVTVVQKYNSQFNPHLAKQNFIKDD